MELDARNIEEFTHQIPPDFLIKQTPLSRISEEFGIIEYQLQLALRSPSCEVENIWIISNPHVTMQFEKRTHVCTFNIIAYIMKYWTSARTQRRNARTQRDDTRSTRIDFQDYQLLYHTNVY